MALDKRVQRPMETVASYVLAMRRLCNEVDPTMNESRKVFLIKRGLLAPIRSDVMKGKPTTVKELLEQAKLSELSLQMELDEGTNPVPVTEPKTDDDGKMKELEKKIEDLQTQPWRKPTKLHGQQTF